MQSGWKDAQGAQVTAVGCPDWLKVWGKVLLKHRVQQVEVSKAQSVNISPTVWKPGDGASWLVVVQDADVNAVRGLRCRVVKVQVSEGECGFFFRKDSLKLGFLTAYSSKMAFQATATASLATSLALVTGVAPLATIGTSR